MIFLNKKKFPSETILLGKNKNHKNKKNMKTITKMICKDCGTVYTGTTAERCPQCGSMHRIRKVYGIRKCPNCQQEYSAEHEHCPNCGSAYLEEKFKLSNPESAPAVPAGKERKGQGHWCGHCNSFFTGEICPNCGNPLDEAKGTANGDDTNYFNKFPQSPETTPQPPRTRSTPRFDWPSIMEGIGSFLLIAGILFLIGWGIWSGFRSIKVTCDHHDWEYVTEIEELKTFTETDWTIPYGGRKKSEFQAFHHNEKVFDGYADEEYQEYEIVGYAEEEYEEEVFDHYESYTYTDYEMVGTGRTQVVSSRDLGNGEFEIEEEEIFEEQPVTKTGKKPIYKTVTKTRTVPVKDWVTHTRQVEIYHDSAVYRTKYTYDIDRWVYNRSVRNSGKDLSPKKGEIVLKNKEKEGESSLSLKIIFKDDEGEEIIREFDSQEEWSSIQDNSIFHGRKIFWIGRRINWEEGPIKNQ